MRCQLHQEMFWPTNSQKQLFDAQYGQYGTLSFLEVYVGLTLKHCTIFDKKREIRPEENLLLLKFTWSSFP